MRILFITPRLPYPPLRGYQVRAHHQLRLLSVQHKITLVCYAGNAISSEFKQKVEQYCHEVITVQYNPAMMLAGVSAGVFRGHPIQSCIHETPAMRRVVARLLGEHRHDIVHVQLSRMAGSVESAVGIPRVIDFVDALSLNLRRRAVYHRGLMRVAVLAEADRLQRHEREICRTWNHATVVSPVDRAAIGDFPNLDVNPSGVDLQQFPYRAEGRDPSTIVFSGNMGYFANVDAISWFAREIFPRVVSEASNSKLLIVGARPARKVKALANLDPRIRVTDLVDRVQPYLQQCTLAIAPMRAGSGQLFKVLEAMASGAPLITTSLVADATEAENGRHLMVADDPESFARCVLRLIREPALAATLAMEARRLVERRYSWERSVSELEEVYHSVVEEGGHQTHQSAAV